jgi:hypothetical protein
MVEPEASQNGNFVDIASILEFVFEEESISNNLMDFDNCTKQWYTS